MRDDRINLPVFILMLLVAFYLLMIAGLVISTVVQSVDLSGLEAVFAPPHPMHPKGY